MAIHNIPEPYAGAHKFSSLNRAAIEASKSVGCFYCHEIYPPSLIDEWIDGDQTPLCPKCGIDSVLPDSQPITVEFLKLMGEFWFSTSDEEVAEIARRIAGEKPTPFMETTSGYTDTAPILLAGAGDKER